jgi:hypothetical protein
MEEGARTATVTAVFGNNYAYARLRHERHYERRENPGRHPQCPIPRIVH